LVQGWCWIVRGDVDEGRKNEKIPTEVKGKKVSQSVLNLIRKRTRKETGLRSTCGKSLSSAENDSGSLEKKCYGIISFLLLGGIGIEVTIRSLRKRRSQHEEIGSTNSRR